MHVFPRQEVLERPRKPVGIPLNVALVMFDSTSAANFVRKMPSSLEYLNKSLGSVFMQGKVTCIWVCWALARRFAHRGHAGGKICDRLGQGVTTGVSRHSTGKKSKWAKTLACFIKYFLRKINVLQQNIIISQLSIFLFIFLHFSELNIDAFCTQFICLSVCESQAVWARVCRFAGWGRFPFVRTDRQGHSRRNENFTFNQSYLAWSVKS